MRQIWYSRNGPAHEVLGITEAAVPELGEGQVLVALEAAPVHIADLKAVQGTLAFIDQTAGVPGFEGVGRIVALSAGVSGWKEGDRVILPLGYGTWRDYVAAEAAALWRAPEHAEASQLALIRINMSTAYLLLHAYRTLGAGDWIIQNAANSNVAGYVAQIAAARGIGVIDVVRRDTLVADLQHSGRQHVLLDGPDLPQQVRALTGGLPILACDAIGGPATARLANCLERGGLVLCYGFLAEQAYQLDYAAAIYRGIQLRGMSIDRGLSLLSDSGRAQMRADIEAIIATQPLNAAIAGIYPFAQIESAMLHAEKTGAARMGKVILVP
jgi:NADPH:quinone reductase-like Zn-dependent oxidoreductase